MHEAFKIFVLSTIVITLWTAFLLVQDKRGTRLLNRWFAGFLVILTLPQMDLYASHAVPGGVPMLAMVASTFLWLKGPFIWAFIDVLARNNRSLRHLALHFIPWCGVLVCLLNFPWLTMKFVLLGMCHMLGYLLVALWRLTRMRAYLMDVWYGFQNSAYYWLLYVIGGVMALAAIDFTVMSLVMSGIFASYVFLDYAAFPAFSVYVLSVGILSVYRPELLFREPAELPEAINPSAEPAPKERYLELDVTLAHTLMQQLTRLMQEQHVYRQNDLSLPDLAAHLGVSVHQLSELLNVHAGLSFYDYLNAHRLEYACSLLADGKCHLRILDIAFEAGYNNKNTFYRVFKDKLGVTPNQYRAGAVSAAPLAMATEEV